MKLTIKSTIPVAVAFLGILSLIGMFCEEMFRAILTPEGMQMLFQEYLWDIAAMTVGALFLLGFSVAGAVYWFSVRPLEEFQKVLHRMSEGNFDEEIKRYSSDEMGDLAVALEKIRFILKSSASEIPPDHHRPSLVDAKKDEENPSSL